METMLVKGTGGSGHDVVGVVNIGKIVTPGAILVTDATDPTMLADIMQASAVVTNEGGALCHAAVVCMEAGIPFVVGTRKATVLLEQGSVIHVRPGMKAVFGCA